MTKDGYRCLRLRVEDGVATATLDHPPVNLLDAAMIGELDRLGREAEARDDVRVLVLESADPEFFVAHADVALILALPPDAAAPPGPSLFQRIVDRFRLTGWPGVLALLAGVGAAGIIERVRNAEKRHAVSPDDATVVYCRDLARP